jgi:tetratricopeptide (TPR) repeat protein
MAASHYLALTCHALGDYRRAAERLRAVIEMAATDATTGEWRTQAGSRAGFLAVNFSWLASNACRDGDFDEAIGFGQQGLELAEHLESPYSLAATTFGLGAVFGMRGEFDRAIPLLERALTTARDWNVTLYECHALRALGYAYMRRGRVDDGLALLRQSASTVETRSLAVQQVRVLALLCEAWVRAGRPDEATTAATRALSLARARGQRGDEATVLSVLARVALAASPPDRESAERRYAEALEHGVRVVHAPASRPLPPRSREALSAHGQAGAGP